MNTVNVIFFYSSIAGCIGLGLFKPNFFSLRSIFFFQLDMSSFFLILSATYGIIICT